MSNALKLLYVLMMPVVLITFYDGVVVTNWAGWTSQYPSLAGVPRWSVLAAVVTIYAVNVWMLVGADWFREFRSNRDNNRRKAAVVKPQSGKDMKSAKENNASAPKSTRKKVMEWTAFVAVTALVATFVYGRAQSTVAENKRRVVDAYYDKAATAVCIAFNPTIVADEKKAVGKGMVEDVGGFALAMSPSGVSEFAGLRIIALDNGRFTFRVADRSALPKYDGMASLDMADLLEQRAQSRSIWRANKASATDETCADFLARVDEQLFRGEIKRNPLLDMDKRPAW